MTRIPSPSARSIAAGVLSLLVAVAACQRSGASLEDAKAALDAGDYDLAKKIAFDTRAPERFEFINSVDAKKKAVEQFQSELKFAVSHAADEGKPKTKETLVRLESSAPTAKLKTEAATALRDIDKWFPAEKAAAPIDPSVKRPERVESDGKARPRRVDETAPEDSLKKKTGFVPSSPQVKELLASIDEEVQAGRYRQAIELIGMASGQLTAADSQALDNVGAEVRVRAKTELTSLVSDVKRDLRTKKTPADSERAIEKLLTRLQDFPRGPECDLLRKRAEELLTRDFTREEALANLDLSTAVLRTVSEEPPSGGAPPPPPRPTPAREVGVDEVLHQAETALAAGDLTNAKAHFLDAAGKATIPALKSDSAARAEECGRMLAFLDRVNVAIAQDATPFKDFDAGAGKVGALAAVDAKGIAIEAAGAKELLTWESLPAAATSTLVKKLGPLPPDEKLGCAVFLAKAKAVKEADLLLKEAVDGDPKLQASVNMLLARRRGVDVPAYGFVWFKNGWTTFTDRENSKLADRVRELLARLDTAGSPTERQAIRTEIQRLGTEATDALVMALRDRRADMVSRLKAANFVKKLAPIREERAKLDKARAYALELIFDEVKYFYPYNPPECPPEKAKLYPEVQQEVDHRVSAVREVWDSKVTVSLGSHATTLRALQDMQSQMKELGASDLQLETDMELCLAIDPKEPELTIRNFCLTPAERRNRLDFNRKVLTFNASSKTTETPEDRRLVSLTNQYREMFGRRMLAVNEKLVQSSRKHAKWMADSGTFSHFSSLPGLKTPFDRMKAEGYTAGVSENIAMSPGPDGAFYGWAHSSGHHRNMLSEGHSEFGCAGIGHDWVQNFGVGDEFRSNGAWGN